MAYDIQLRLPEGWQQETETYEDEGGAEITHLEAHRYNSAAKRDDGYIDIYVGPLPEDTSAEDQALSNYADIVGFGDDDPEDVNPIAAIRFNGKKAYGFDAFFDDESPMMFLSQEVKSGVLALMMVAGSDDENLKEALSLVERGLRVR
jgi:hypothetical protein